MNLKQTTQTLKAAIGRDVKPESEQHWARVVLGGLAVAGGVFKYVTHEGVWVRDDIYALALMLLLGFGIVFTGSVIALLKAIPVPWRRNGNGAPPA